MSETLEWYGKRGLLSASDEESSTNIARLSAGRAVARAFQNSHRQEGLIGHYGPRYQGKGRDLTALNYNERLVEAAANVEALLAFAPPRTRAAVQCVCLMDKRVGKPMMERLRCGLDAISHKITKSK